MNKLRKLFGGVKMTWGKVILLAVISAVVTAGLNVVPALKETSLQDPAISFEVWFVLAIFLIVNCDKWWEASLKCFVFFLISQPLIYLIEVPFLPDGWGLFRYYGHWFKLTVLTLPGAAVAFLLKKKNWLSVPVLSVATGFMAYMCVYYAKAAAFDFPHHILSSIFCAVTAVLLIFTLLDKRSHRIIALALVALIIVGFGAYTVAVNSGGVVRDLYLDDGVWTASGYDENVVTVEITDGNYVKMESVGNGDTIVDFTGEDGRTVSFAVFVSGRNFNYNILD